jgi:NDP-sugar pyrophosphorylase family protein
LPNTDRTSRLTAAILAGGLGTRTRALLGDTPKVLAPVTGRPFLDHLIGYLADWGISDIVLCTGHGADKVRDFCEEGERWDVRIRYSREDSPLGTAGALSLLASVPHSDPMLVMNGDSLCRTDLEAMVHFHGATGAGATILLVEVDDRGRFGSVTVNGGGAIAGFEEKGRQGRGWISAGTYLLGERFTADLPDTGSIEQDVFPAHVGIDLYGHRAQGELIDIGTVEAYQQATSRAEGPAL